MAPLVYEVAFTIAPISFQIALSKDAQTSRPSGTVTNDSPDDSVLATAAL